MVDVVVELSQYMERHDQEVQEQLGKVIMVEAPMVLIMVAEAAEAAHKATEVVIAEELGGLEEPELKTTLMELLLIMGLALVVLEVIQVVQPMELMEQDGRQQELKLDMVAALVLELEDLEL